MFQIIITMNKINTLALGLFIIANLMLMGGCGRDKVAQTAAPMKVEVIKVQQRSVPVSKDYIGTTSSMADVDIRARVQGFLLSFDFVEGQIVKQGELLFVIDPNSFKAQLAAAKAQLDESIATAAFNKIDAERKYKLYKEKAVSEQESDQAQASYKESAAAVEANKANVVQAQINLSYCYVYSPIEGVIGETLVDVGNLVGGTENTLLANVVKLNPIYVSFNPSVNDYGEFLKYKTNKPFKVEVTLPQQKDYKFNGEIDLVNNQADISTSTLLMRAVVNNSKNTLLPGIYVNVKLLLGNNPKAILIPSTTVMTEQTIRYVYVVNANKEVVTAPIQSQLEYQNDLIIDSGLKPGDLVITNNLQKIRPGMKVDPVITKDHKP